MKDLKDILITEKIADEETIVLSPEDLKKVLEYIKGKEDKGLCLRYTWNDDDEWYQIDACHFDERGDKGPRNWPWKKLYKSEGVQ